MSPDATAGVTPIQRVEMESFARRLHHKMLEKGMSQSDLAAKIWGRTVDKRGYDVARNRDRISVYLKGESLPDPVNLERLAQALGCSRDELAPEIAASAVERDNPEIAMTMVAGHADKVFLRVNKLVPLGLASKVIALLADAA